MQNRKYFAGVIKTAIKEALDMVDTDDALIDEVNDSLESKANATLAYLLDAGMTLPGAKQSPTRATLEFDLPEAHEEFENAVNGWKYKSNLEDIWDNVFRPFYKHGYRDQELNELLDKMGEDGDKLMEKLADLYRETINNNN